MQKFSKKKQLGNRSKDKKTKLIASLDRYFKKYIRLRDSEKFNHEYFQCISCQQIKKCDGNYHAGHYINSTHWTTRWNEKNVNGQCCHCNTFEHGALLSYKRNLDIKWGKGTSDMLEDLSGVHSHYTVEGLKEDIEKYKMKLKQF